MLPCLVNVGVLVFFVLWRGQRDKGESLNVAAVSRPLNGTVLSLELGLIVIQ